MWHKKYLQYLTASSLDWPLKHLLPYTSRNKNKGYDGKREKNALYHICCISPHVINNIYFIQALQKGEKYPDTSDKWVYTFYPGNKTNIKTVISKIKELHAWSKESACIDIPNDLLNSENKIDNSVRDSSADNMIL